MKHLLSFDFEEWFHLIQNDVSETGSDAWNALPVRIEVMTALLLDFLRARKVKATFFVLGWIAERYPHLVAKIAAEGHEIACHSHLHRPVWSLSPEEFSKDLRASLDAIERASGIRPNIFRAPGFSIDSRALWAFEAMAEQGIVLDSSIYPGSHTHGGIPSAPRFPFTLRTDSGASIREFPISTFSFFGRQVTFSGGGYFRILPLYFQRRFFRSFEEAGNPVVTYFHPRDFDTQIPDSGLGWLRELKSNLNVAGALDKLEAVLSEFPMGTLTEVSQSCDWSLRPTLYPLDLLGAQTFAPQVQVARRPLVEKTDANRKKGAS